jgi:16S rRNA (uracil1498-N3)-methyltransferase
LEFLSDIELYYTESVYENSLSITGDEVKHITRVMRHNAGDELHITDGRGFIYTGKIISISKERVDLQIISHKYYENIFNNIFFCLPKLKSSERLEFAIEKCIELGISNFIFYESERTIKSSIKIARIEKIALAAMKQSLHSYKPVLSETNSIDTFLNLDGSIILLEQKCENKLTELILDKKTQYYFLFGPEGGFSNSELQKLKDKTLFRISSNRLRTETAAVGCASILQTLI